jgi:hypothetical protein
MTRNCSTLTLATLLALASTAPAQKVTWHPAGPEASSQSTESACPVQRYPGCEATVWGCQTESCEGIHVTHGKEAAARMLMPDLMAEFLQVFNDGNLDRAELIAEFACKLQPDNKVAQRARWLVSIAKQARLPAEGAEECSESVASVKFMLRRLGATSVVTPAAKCNCGDKCCCKNECKCENCDDKCACKASAVLRRECVPYVNVHHPKLPELLPEPTLVEESAVPPASLPAERDELVASTEVQRVIIKVPGIVAQSDHAYLIRKNGEPRRILLEGNVEMYLNQGNQPAKIFAGRVLINPHDGTYEVMPVPGKPMSLKPTIIVPASPMEQGWR